MSSSEAPRKYILGMLFGLLFVASNGALAQAERQSAPANEAPGVLKALNRAGCTPAWTTEALGMGRSGTVQLQLQINRKGQVTDARLVASSGYKDLDDATITAASKCRYLPSTRKGAPATSSVTYTHVWELPAPPPRPEQPFSPVCDKPEYPPASRRYNETGTVRASFLIATDGLVVDKKLIQSSGFSALDKAAIEGIAKCRFKPATLNGIPQQEWQDVTYVWTLE